MRLLDRIRSTPTVQRAFVPDPGTFMQSTYGAGTGERVLAEFLSYAQQGYQGNAAVFSTILARLQLFAEATFKLRDVNDKSLSDSPVLDLLRNPWPGATTGEMLARMEQDASLAGNAFIARAESQLMRLRPDWVEIASEIFKDPVTGVALREVIGYVYRVDGDPQQLQIFDVADVAHWSPIPDPLAYWRGMSWLTPIVREINSDIAMEDHRKSFFENAATPNMMIRYPKPLRPGMAEQLAARFAARHGGPENAGRTVVLDEGADLTVVGSSFAEMSFTDVQAAGETRIAAAGGVPPVVIGLSKGLDSATYANYALAMRRFADITMRPNWRSAAACLAKLVEIPAGKQLWYDVSDIAALREGESDRAQRGWTVAQSVIGLTDAGYTPESVIRAVVSDDFGLLEHSGLVSVQLLPPGTVREPAKPPTAGQSAAANDSNGPGGTT